MSLSKLLRHYATRSSRGIALDMARFNMRSNCVSPFGWTRMVQSIPAETEEEKVWVARASQIKALGLVRPFCPVAVQPN
jgi:hypothetical protein